MPKRERRYVVDTNVLVSGLLFESSTPGRALRLALQVGTLLLSRDTLVELIDVVPRSTPRGIPTTTSSWSSLWQGRRK